MKSNYFIYFFTFESFVSFIFGFEVRPTFFWNLLITNPVYSDIDFYFSFVQNFPILYEKITWNFYPVFYLPQFFLYFYPFFLLNDLILIYNIMSFINLLCVPLLIYLIFKLPKIYKIISIFILFNSLYTLSQWGNAEIQIALVTIYVYVYIAEHKNFKIWQIILLAFFSFKMISIIILLPIYFEIGFKKTLKFATLLIAFIFLFNFWYVIINFNQLNLAFILDILANRSSLTYNWDYYIHLISFSLPLSFFCIKICKKFISFIVNSRNSKKLIRPTASDYSYPLNEKQEVRIIKSLS